MRCLAILLLAAAVAAAQPGRFGPPGGGGIRGPGGGRSQEPKVEYKPEELCFVGGIVRAKSSGEPISKATVSLMRMDRRGSGGRPASTATAVDGQFTFTGIEPGQYRLMVQRNGYVSQQYGGRPGGFNNGTTLTLAKSESLKGLDIRMVPHAVITGRVFDEDGEPLARVNVQLMRYVYRDQGKALMPAGADQTNDLGEFRIFGVSAGRYFVQARGFGGMENAQVFANRPDEAYAPTYYPGTNDPASASAIDVPVGGHVQGIDIRLGKTRTYRVAGIVSGGAEGGRPGMIMLLPRSRDGLGMTTFERPSNSWDSRTGKFELRNVQPGSYNLIALSFNGSGGSQRSSAAVPVDVGQEHVRGLQVMLSPGQEVSGRVRIEGQENASLPSELHVFLEASNLPMFGGAGDSRVDADGTFRMQSVVASTYRLRIRGLPEGHYIQSVRMAERDLLASGLEMTAGAPATGIEIVLNPNGANVGGNVTDDKGEPAAGAQIVLMPPQDQPNHDLRIQRVAADQNGQFQISGIPPGEYRLYAFTGIDEGADRDPEFLKKYESRAEKLTLRESGQETKTVKSIDTSGQ
jgi:protocatechuate 3,4-dioxygenase beta subunit